MKAVLTIAGSDSGGGAGIQGDLKTIEAHGCYGMSVITGVTAQNTKGILAVEEVSGKILQNQLEAVLSDIRPAAIKIGMVYSRENVEIISKALQQWEHGPVVLDPVLASTSGQPLLKPWAIEVLEKQLFPQVTLLTPNLPEAGTLLGERTWPEDSRMEEAVRALSWQYGMAVLLKGGHRERGAHDVLCIEGQVHWFLGEQIQAIKGSHGTGCALSSAIACNLAAGMSLPEAIKAAKIYVTGALLHAPGLGRGNGPLHHGWRKRFPEKAGEREE